MSHSLRRLALLSLIGVIAAACSDGNGESGDGDGDEEGTDGVAAEDVDISAGLTGEPIKLINILEASGTALANPEIPEGAEAAALAVNTAGGIDGRPIEILVCDTANDPNTAAECGRQAVDEGVVAVVSSLTIHAGEFYPLLEENKIPSLGDVPAGVPEFTSPASFPLIGGAPVTLAAVAQGLAGQGAQRIAVARPDLAAGAAIPGFMNSALENEGLEVINDVPVPESSPDMAPFVEAALDNDADAIAVFLSGQDATNYLIAARQADPDVMLGTFSTDVGGLREALGEQLDGVITSSSTTLLLPTGEQDREQYESDMMAAGYDDFSGNRISGYTAVLVFAEIAPTLGEITPSALFDALNQLDGLDIGFYPPIQFVEGGVMGLPRIFNPCAVAVEYEGVERVPLADELSDPVNDTPCEL